MYWDSIDQGTRSDDLGGPRLCYGFRDDIICYLYDLKELQLTDILIRDVSDDVVAAIEANAKRVGLSKAEYLRRTLNREHRSTGCEVTVESLQHFSETFADLADPDVIHATWS